MNDQVFVELSGTWLCVNEIESINPYKDINTKTLNSRVITRSGSSYYFTYTTNQIMEKMLVSVEGTVV